MKSPIKDATQDFKCISMLKELIPRGSIVASHLFYGGALEFNLAEAERFVCAHTTRYVVYEFWKCALENPERLYEMVSSESLRFENQTMFHLLQESWPQYADPYLRSSLFFILNRCSDQGLISSGKLDMKNFNPIALSHLRNFKVPNFHLQLLPESDTVDHVATDMDADYLLLPLGEFNYNLFNAGKSRGFETVFVDHPKLATHLKKMEEQKWILLYKSHPALFELYKDARVIQLDEYGRKTHQQDKTQEILIANF
jgi:site-specific DNA-adenine methylase